MLKIERVSAGIKGAFRIGQTTSILAKTGIDWLSGERPPTPKLLRETFEKLGTTYIKLGQFIASSPSVFPDEYVEEFQLCLDKTQPVPFHTMKAVLKKELGKSLDNLFSYINPEPLASASIAQVYAATLTTGEDVVIKIQKPGVRNILLADLNFLFTAAKILEHFIPNISIASLSDVIDEIQKGMLAECDFYQEARNIEAFQAFIESTDNPHVIAPKVYKQASTQRVLTMERLYGAPFTDLESIRKFTPEPEAILLNAMNTWFSSLLFCESFHADVHAGNLLVLEDGRIGFIDFGIVGRVRPETWDSVSKFIESISKKDYQAMAESMLGIGMTDRVVDTQQLAKDIEGLYEGMDDIFMTDPMSLNKQGEQQLNKVMIKLVGIGKNHGIHFPREFALLLKQLLYFDRYVRILTTGNSNIYADERLIMNPALGFQSLH